MLLLAFLQNVLALSPSSAHKWILSLPTSVETQTIISQYNGLSAEFSSQLFSWMNQQLAKSSRSALSNHQENNCTESNLFKIVDGQKLFPTLSETEKKFTDSLVLVETAYCLPNINLEQAYSVYMSEEFRTDVMPQVISFQKNGSIYCTKGSAILGVIKPSQYCQFSHTKKDEGSIVLRNALHSVASGDSFQPFYIREEIISFVQMKDGVGFYRATFTRSDDLNSASKYILRTTVDSSQSNIREQYYDWLKK